MEARRRSRRASRRADVEPPAWDEPDAAADSPRLRSTNQSIADFPARGALATIEDPDRHRRQLSRPQPRKLHRKRRASASDDDDDFDPEQRARDARGDKLFIKLKSRLVPGSEISNLRETPRRGAEDYRHGRTAAAERELANGAKRLAAASAAAASSSKRHRRAARPSFDDSLLPPDAEPLAAAARPSPPPPHEPARRRRSPGARAASATASETASPEPEPASAVAPDAAPARPVAKIKKGAPDDGSGSDIVNNDYCTACGGTGEFLCCETCPRSFHFSCLEAPVMDVDELPDEPWSCRHCAPRPLPAADLARAKQTLFGSLIIAFESQNAMAFQLPTHIREMFSHIHTSRYGEYVDEPMKSEGVLPGPRILDKNGDALLCYKCQGAGLGTRPLAVCSKCREPWHIDCVDPPLESTPLGYWVCPLHAENIADLPLRVRKPILTPVALKRQIANDGDIEITDDDDDDDARVDATSFAGSFADEEVVRHVVFPAQTRVLPNGTVAAKGPKHRPRGFELDRVVYKLPARAVKLDFLDAVHRLNSEPYRETPTSSVLTVLDELAEKPQPEREAVRNLMTLKLQGPAVDAAQAHRNLGLLVEAALNDADENSQIAAIKKLMKEKGRERLLQMLKD